MEKIETLEQKAEKWVDANWLVDMKDVLRQHFMAGYEKRDKEIKTYYPAVTIGRLEVENKKLQEQNTRQAGTISQLSAEIRELKTQVEEQAKTRDYYYRLKTEAEQKLAETEAGANSRDEEINTLKEQVNKVFRERDRLIERLNKFIVATKEMGEL